MTLPNEVFIDTSFFIALLNISDADHAHAVKLQTQATDLGIHKITSEYVLVELGDGLSRLRFRYLASSLIQLVRQDSSFEIVPASTELLTEAIALFDHREDKEWGLTDCSSFVIMRQMGLTSSFTADHHFQQAGFQALLLSEPE